MTDETLRTILIVLAAILLLPFLMMLLFIPFGMAGGGMYGGGMWGGSTGGWLGPLFWLLPLLVIGGLAYLLLTRGPTGSADDDALEELRLAYARGDIDEEEFERRRSVLAPDDDR